MKYTDFIDFFNRYMLEAFAMKLGDYTWDIEKTFNKIADVSYGQPGYNNAYALIVRYKGKVVKKSISLESHRKNSWYTSDYAKFIATLKDVDF